MWLEVLSSLPSEARIFLQVPEKDWKVLGALRELGPIMPVETKSLGLGRAIQLNPHGRSRTTKILFPKTKEFRSQCLLLVHIPEKFRKYPYEISIRQMSDNQEVGRLTWRLTQKQEVKKGVTLSFVERLIVLHKSLVRLSSRR